MADILPRPAGAFPFKCAEARCYGQPKNQANLKSAPRFGANQKCAPENANCNSGQTSLMFGLSPENTRKYASKLSELFLHNNLRQSCPPAYWTGFRSRRQFCRLLLLVRPLMRFRVTSVASKETGALLNEASVKVEDWLNVSLSDGKFGEGVDQFTIVAISVNEEAEENIRWSNTHNKTGRFKNPFTREHLRYVSSAVLLPPSSVISKAPHALLSYFCSATIERLKSPPKRVPKGFEYERCALSVSKALEVYVQQQA